MPDAERERERGRRLVTMGEREEEISGGRKRSFGVRILWEIERVCKQRRGQWGERERERERETERDRERERQTEERQRETDRQTERERQTDRQRETDRQTDRQRHGLTNRQASRNRGKSVEERESWIG